MTPTFRALSSDHAAKAEEHGRKAEEYRRLADACDEGNVGEEQIAALLDTLDGAGWGS